MFFILSKTLDFLFVPISWVLIVLIFAVFKKNKKIKKRAYRVAIIMLLFFTNSVFINLLLYFWEKPATPITELDKHDVAIVLTGVTNPYKHPKDRVYMNKGADRILHTLMLYRLGKVKKIVITGGVTTVFGRTLQSEAMQLKKILLHAKVPSEDIILEEKAKNTYENAVFTAKLLKEKFPNQKYLLVTSAFHIPRAQACFLKQNIKVTPFSVDFYTVDLTEMFSFSSLIPNANALNKWSVLTHEVAGYIIYKITGKA